MVICTNLVSFLQHSVGIHFSRTLNDTSSLISVLLFCLHAKRSLHRYTILMKYDRIFVSYFGLHRFNVHSTHISTWEVCCFSDISWPKVPVTTCGVAAQIKDQPVALAQMGLEAPGVVLFLTAAPRAHLSQVGALLPHTLPCSRRGCHYSFSVE